jgi:putative colanic acid biosynthesis UDP-glucose lipid carrier transferase
MGSLADFDTILDMPVNVSSTNEEEKNDSTTKFPIPDELYCSLSWTKRDEIRRIRKFCDRHVVHFYFIPVFAESFGHTLKIEQIGETVGYTNYIDPLQSPTNRAIKRVFDVIFSLLVLIPMAFLTPLIALIIKLQSPGPIFFRQLRTGMNGRSFYCYKFRSMHVNSDADRVQATKDDPRKFPFGNFMRKANIDELPQFWNVLKGDMSIVGPRPHMLAHTEQYSELIDKYMVRHFVKPGVTGWAQVTGYRGETKELWQMEGRVKRDIWYIENWSIWLDLRIIWLTARQIVIHDEKAY